MNINNIITTKKIEKFDKLKNVFLTDATIIYLPSKDSMSGADFVNKFRKEGIISEVLLFPIYTFLHKKESAANYIKEFKEKNPNVIITKEFKNKLKNKIKIVDLTMFSNLFYQLSIKQRFISFNKMLSIINDLKDENNYLFYNGSSLDSEFLNSFLTYFRKHNNKLEYNKLEVNGVLGYTYDEEKNNVLYPLTYLKEEKDEKFHKLNLNIVLKYQQEVLKIKDTLLEKEIEDISDIEKDPELAKLSDEDKKIREIINDTEKSIDKIFNVSEIDKLKKESNKLDSKTDLEENIIDDIYNSLSKLNPDKNIYENFEYLKEYYKKNNLKGNFLSKIDNFLKEFEKLNKKYNGAIDINKDIMNKGINQFYDPTEIVGMKTINVFNRQKTEFEDVLDDSMRDLIYSIEKDKEAGIKVKEIKSEIIDNNKDRLKVYTIKLKNTKHGTSRLYSQKLKVPYPINNKYIKLGNTNYIMINQFYPKPLLKVKHNLVRLYTFYSTTAVMLSSHSINEIEGFTMIKNKLSKADKLKRENFYDENEKEKLNTIIKKYNLNIIDDVFLQGKIKIN